MLVAGYHNDEEATTVEHEGRVLQRRRPRARDRDGRYFIEGRKRDMIISGGVNVYPAEVEAVLEAHPEVPRSRSSASTIREWGERVRAFVVRRSGAEIDEALLKVWTRERLAGPKVPRDFVFIEVLPRNPTGKVLKRDLRSWKK